METVGGTCFPLAPPLPHLGCPGSSLPPPARPLSPSSSSNQRPALQRHSLTRPRCLLARQEAGRGGGNRSLLSEVNCGSTAFRSEIRPRRRESYGQNQKQYQKWGQKNKSLLTGGKWGGEVPSSRGASQVAVCREWSLRLSEEDPRGGYFLFSSVI